VRLTNTPHSQTVNDWSPDGKFLLYTETSTEAELDLWALPMSGDHKPFVYMKPAFRSLEGVFLQMASGSHLFPTSQVGRKSMCEAFLGRRTGSRCRSTKVPIRFGAKTGRNLLSIA
jgi:hypothetical protein